MLAWETQVFLIACLLGAGIGLFFDVFRIFRIIIPHQGLVVFLEDIIFCIVTILVSFAFIISMGQGILRGFMIFGEFIGAVVYFFTLGIGTTKTAKKMRNICARIIFLFKKQKTLEFDTKSSV